MLQKWPSRVPPLLTLCSDYVLDHLRKYSNDADCLSCLPLGIKDKLLKKLLLNSFFWKGIDFKKIFGCLVHSKIRTIDLTCILLDDELLRLLEICKSLQRIYLTTVGTNNFTKYGLMKFLKCIPELQFLQLRRCDIVDDTVLECISENCKQLTALDLGGCTKITDSGFRHLKQLKGLKYITLSNTQISNDGLIEFIKGSQGAQLEELLINNCRNITSIGLQAVTEYCPNLEILVFYNCGNDTSISIVDSNMKNLRQLTWSVSWEN